MSEVLVISKPACPMCTTAKNMLKAKGVEFKEQQFDVGQPREEGMEYIDVAQFKKDHPEVASAPQIIIDGQLIGGVKNLVEWLKSE